MPDGGIVAPGGGAVGAAAGGGVGEVGGAGGAVDFGGVEGFGGVEAAVGFGGTVDAVGGVLGFGGIVVPDTGPPDPAGALPEDEPEGVVPGFFM